MIGLISDTHGMLRKEVLENLKDCNLILHAGDIGKPEVIDNLKDISNIEFIRGNCDKDKNIGKEDKVVDVHNKRIYLIHDISKVNINLKEENIDVVVYGHSLFFCYIFIFITVSSYKFYITYFRQVFYYFIFTYISCMYY